MKIDEIIKDERIKYAVEVIINELLELSDELGLDTVIGMIAGYMELKSNEILNNAYVHSKGEMDHNKLEMLTTGNDSRLSIEHLSRIHKYICDIEQFDRWNNKKQRDENR